MNEDGEKKRLPAKVRRERELFDLLCRPIPPSLPPSQPARVSEAVESIVVRLLPA